jgi:MYXO-CTERM domain-containing protein
MVRLLGAILAVAVLALPSSSSQAALIGYAGTLVPEGGGGRTGTGSVFVTIDDVANSMRVQATFSGLSGTTTASHIHAPTASPGSGNAGVATAVPTFPGFPLGVTAGTFDTTYDMTLASSYNPAFVTANGGTADSARAALFLFLAQGRSYLNIHTTTFPGGEIRANLAVVPEPSSVVLAAVGGLGLLGAAARRRRRR